VKWAIILRIFGKGFVLFQQIICYLF
jgi:hypothetical protein